MKRTTLTYFGVSREIRIRKAIHKTNMTQDWTSPALSITKERPVWLVHYIHFTSVLGLHSALTIHFATCVKQRLIF